MAKKKKGRKKNGLSIPIAVVGPIAYNLAQRIDEINRGVSWATVMDRLQYSYTGYSTELPDKFKWERMNQGAFPLLVGAIVHKVAGRMGINRAIAATGIPYIRI